MGKLFFTTPAKPFMGKIHDLHGNCNVPFVIHWEFLIPPFAASRLMVELSRYKFQKWLDQYIPILKRKTYYWNYHEEISRSSNFWIGIIPLFCFLYFLKYSFSQRLLIKFNDIFKNAKILKIAPLEPKLWKKFYQLAIGIDFMLYQFLWGIEFMLCQFLWGIDFTTFNSS